MWTASLSKLKPQDFTLRQKQTLARKIMACAHMADEGERVAILRDLNMDVSQSSQRNVHVLEIIQYCSRFPGKLKEFLESLDFFEDGSFQMQEVDELLCEWIALAELKRLLNAVSISKADAIRECHKIEGTQAILQNNGSNGDLLSNLVDSIAELSVVPPARAPLLEFLERCLPHFQGDNDDVTALKDWVRAVAATQQVDLAQLQTRIGAVSVTGRDAGDNKVVEEEAINPEVFLLIELIPKRLTPELENDKFDVRAWRYDFQDSEDVSPAQSSCLLADMSGPIEEILSKVRSAVVVAEGQMTIEFLLPSALLYYPVEQWKRADGIPLGDRYRVIVRSRNRVRDNVDDGLVKKRWKAERLEEALQKGWFRQFAQISQDLNELRTLQVETEIFCLVLESGPPQNPEDRAALLKRIAALGIPIVFWPRSAIALETVQRKALAGLIKTRPLRQLPYEIQVRRTAGFPFVLLWDDPKRCPPKEDYFSAP